MSVHNFPDKGVLPPAPPGGSLPPMELTERVANLEKSVIDLRMDVSAIKQRLDSELPQLATKADMHQEFSAQTWKIMGLMATLILGVFGLMRAFPPKIEIPPIQVQYVPQQSMPSSPSQPASTQSQQNKLR